MNKNQFNRWKKTAQAKADKLGLKDYRLYFSFANIDHDDLRDDEQLIGHCLADESNRWASLVLNKSCDLKLTWDELDENATHEVLELFFNEIRELLLKYYSVDLVCEVIHKKIRTLEKLI